MPRRQFCIGPAYCQAVFVYPHPLFLAYDLRYLRLLLAVDIQVFYMQAPIRDDSS